MTTTWTISIDWDRSGNFDGTYDDVTDRVISANWFLGMREPYQDDADDSMLELRLSNHDQCYSPEYASSPLHEKLMPFRPVQVQSNDDTGIEVTGALTVPDGSGGTTDGPIGGFLYDGTHNTKASYKSVKPSSDGGGGMTHWYIWYDLSASRYRITQVKDSTTDERWLGPASGDLAGSYTAEGGASGTATVSAGVTFIHWTGWIERIQPTVNQYGERVTKITAAGPMQFYKAAETALELQENMRTDQIIAALLKEVVVPPALGGAWFLGLEGSSELGISTYLANTTAYSDLDEGQTTLAIAADNWVRRGGLSNEEQDTFNVSSALQDVVAAERGRFFFARDGKAIFWNRHHLLLDDTVSEDFDNTMIHLSYSYADLDHFKNEIIVTCHPRTIGASANDILWQLENDVRIPAGATRTIAAKYQDDSDNRIGGKDVTVTDVIFSEGTATVTLDARANSARLEITNNGSQKAIMTSCIVRGKKITDFGRMEAEARDNISIAKYGRRTLNLNLPSVDNFDDAQSIANFELIRRKNPRGAVGRISLLSHATEGGNQHGQQLARTIGDLIQVIETQTAHNDKYHIIGEAHELTEGGDLYKTTWFLEPAPAEHYPWALGVPGRAELGQKTTLTY
jgi:hypothetical protein